MDTFFFLFAASTVFCLVMIGYAIALGSAWGVGLAIAGVLLCMGLGFYIKSKRESHS